MQVIEAARTHADEGVAHAHAPFRENETAGGRDGGGAGGDGVTIVTSPGDLI
jgi:hypothetical protein